MRKAHLPFATFALLSLSAIGIGWLALRPESTPVHSSTVQHVEPTVQNAAAPVAIAKPRAKSEPQLAAFSEWTREYLAAPQSAKNALVSKGVQLAMERRAFLANLIRTEPERAIAEALPVAVRGQLPPEIVPLLEERVSGRGDLHLLGVTPAPGQRVAEPVYRVAHLGKREFRAFTYGRRAKLMTVENTSIHGVAIDNLLAVADSPVRVLEPGEPAAGRKVSRACVVEGMDAQSNATSPLHADSAVAIEIGGEFKRVCQCSKLRQIESAAIDAMDSGLGSSGVAGRPAQSWTHGTKKVLIIRVDFSDRTGTPVVPANNAPITDEYAVNLFNDANGIRDFFAVNSFGKTALSIAPAVAGNSPDVTDVLRMPSTSASYATTGNNAQLHTDARNLATAAGFNMANYDRIGVVFANLGSIPGSLITYGGLGNIQGANFWVNGHYDFRVVAHEVGHNYGLFHSNLWKVTDGNPVSAAGSTFEYGDDFCVMGEGDFPEFHFSHWNKSILQWIPDTSVTTVSTGGTYRIFRFDTQGANLANALALKIVRTGTHDYWIGHRRATTNAALDNGAYVLWGYNENRQSNLLDLNTPGTSNNDAALQVGQSFTDTTAGITLTTVARGGSGNDEWLDVQVAFQPRIQFSRAQFVANEAGGSAVLTLTRTNNSAGAVSVNYNTAPGTATAPADFTTSSGTVSWAAGDSADKTITIPVVADSTAEGTENFTVSLSGIVGGVLPGATSATVVVADPGARDPQFETTFINNTVEKVLVLPDGKIIGAGWFDVIQDTSSTLHTRGGIARFNADGTFDPEFGVDGGVDAASFPRVQDVARQPDGKLVIGGVFTSVNGIARSNIARLNADGSLDSSFNVGTGANDIVYSVLALPDGKIVIGGAFTTVNGQAKRMLARLNADGSVDATFTPLTFGAGGGWRVETLAAQADGKIVVGGTFYFSGANFKSGLTRALATGAVDTAFNGVVQGAHAAGDPGNLSAVREIEVLGDGSILVSGSFSAFNNTPRGGIAKLTATGSLDAAFDPASNGEINALRVQPDGKILVGGTFTTLNGVAAGSIGRLTALGGNDAGFIAAGGHDDNVDDFAFQPDGRVVMGGNFGSFQGAPDNGPLWRFYAGLSALPGTVRLSAESAKGIEGTTLTLTATRTGGTAGAITVGYSTVAASATAGTDFTTTSGTLSWANGDGAAKTISIPVLSDALADNGETFLVNLGESLIGTALLDTTQQATATISTAFGAWQTANFTAPELADINTSGDQADPDGDGRNNLTEFALGTAPKIPDGTTTLLPGKTNVSGSDYLTLTFRRRAPALDLTYTVQNNDLLGTSWTATAVQVGSATSSGDGTETVTFRDDTPISSTTQRYLRLQIQRVP